MDEIIYIVEDDEGIRELYEGAFEDVFTTKMFENGKDFFSEFAKNRPSLIILDIMLPDMDGYTILTKIREMDEKIPVIIGKHDIKNNEARASFRKFAEKVLAVFKHFRSKNTLESAFVQLADALVVFYDIDHLIHQNF